MIGIGFRTVASGGSSKYWDYVDPYLYLGVASLGSITSANVWTITRVEVFLDGTTDSKSATNVAWDDRLTIIYS